MESSNRSQALVVLASLALAATSHPQTSNDVPLSNGGDVLFTFPTPTVGSSGASWGELYWRTLPGDRILAHQHGISGAQTMEVSGFHEQLFDTDWATSPPFYDRLIGPAVPSAVPCGLDPAFLQTGLLTTETLVSLGPSGFGSPCTLVPSLCSPTGSTCTGLGWTVDILIGSGPGDGVVVPADGTSGSDLAITYVVPGGMTIAGGACGQGDYANQQLYSNDETQVDDCGGVSAFSGFHLPGAGAGQPDAVTDSPVAMVGFREPVLNVVADSGGGVEVGANGGGALNGLKLDTSAGSASIGLEVRDLAGVGELAAVGAAFAPLGPPGPTFLRAHLLILPTIGTPSCFSGSVIPMTFGFTPEGAFVTCQAPLPPVPGQVDVYWQGLILDPVALTARNTNRVRTTLY
jgi:hypothetical protein